MVANTGCREPRPFRLAADAPSNRCRTCLCSLRRRLHRRRDSLALARRSRKTHRMGFGGIGGRTRRHGDHSHGSAQCLRRSDSPEFRRIASVNTPFQCAHDGAMLRGTLLDPGPHMNRRNTGSSADQKPPAPIEHAFMRPVDVCALLRISKPTLWRLRRAGEFPAPTSLSRRSIGWRRADIEAWITSRSQTLVQPSLASGPSTPHAKRGLAQIPLELTR